MKFNKKILITNLIVCLLIFFSFEIAFFIKGQHAENSKHNKFINFPQNITYEELTKVQTKQINKNEKPRFLYNAGEEYKNGNNSVILTGCSFAYSFGLNYGDSLAYQLAHKAKRPVLNRAKPASGPNETLYILSNEKFYTSHEEPEYIIYLFIENHFSRMFSKIYTLQSNKLRPLYDIDEKYNNKLKVCWYKPLFLSHIFKFFYREKITLNYGIIDEEKFLRTMIASKNHIKNHWKNTKFIILRYSEANIEKPFLFSNKFIAEVQKNGIIYFDADELVFGKNNKRLIGNEYMQEDQHPSALAFKLLTNELSKKL